MTVLIMLTILWQAAVGLFAVLAAFLILCGGLSEHYGWRGFVVMSLAVLSFVFAINLGMCDFSYFFYLAVGITGGLMWSRRSRLTDNRDKWLVHHFSTDGARRWRANDKLFWRLSSYSNRKPLSSSERRYFEAALGPDFMAEPHRTADGGCRGFVVDSNRSNLDYGFKQEIFAHPPWQQMTFKYSYRHADSIYDHKASYGSQHGEPRGSDWLAAGYWDPIKRWDDGVEVDPLMVLANDKEIGSRKQVWFNWN